MPFETILITGAAGRLGTELRHGLAPLARQLRRTDRVQIRQVQPNEQVLTFDLTDAAAMLAAAQGVDVIVHLGGAPLEKPWDDILNDTIRGSYDVHETARKAGVKRVIYASSVHAIGYHSIEDHIDTTTPHRPDGLYGLAKGFVEDLGRLYWDKFGIETAALRIFSSIREPTDHRMLWSWLSFADCVRGVTAPRVGFAVFFGLSGHRVKPVDNARAAHPGFHPQDNTEPCRAGVEARLPWRNAIAPAVQRLGGRFVERGHPNDEVAE